MTEQQQEKDKIVRFAQQKFFSEGFYKTTMDEISRELQISKKTIYKFFPSKENLVEEITDCMLYDTNCEVDSIIDSDENVVMKFVRLLNQHLNIVSKFSSRWYRDLQLHTPHILKKMDKMRNEKIIRAIRKLLEQGKREKLIEHYPSEIIVVAFISTFREVMNPDFIIANKFSMHQALKFTFEMLLSGILTAQGKDLYIKTKEDFEKNLGKR
jgi:AcrR family transcriptional regulator